jgi:hypothetical protein
MDYKSKYLKYKNKYIQLQKQIGKGLGDPDTFFLYTTGLADGGSNSVIAHWNRFFRNAILDNIPPRYTKIEIIHSDPSFNQESHDLLMQDWNLPRVDSSIVTNDIIDFTELDRKHRGCNYLVIDSAHLFAYPVPNMVNNSEAYSFDPESMKSFGKHSGEADRTFPLRSLYAGFFGYPDSEPKNEYCVENTQFGKYRLFTIPENGIPITYIDRLFQNHIEFNPHNPPSFSEDIYKKIRPKLQALWIEKHGRTFDDFDKLLCDTNTEIFNKIFNSIINENKNIATVTLEVVDIFKARARI